MNGSLDDAQEVNFTPMTRAQAQALRLNKPQLSIRVVLLGQLMAALTLGLGVYGLAGRDAAASVLYGSLAIWLPSAWFGRGVSGKFASLNAASATVGFFVWEFWKIMLTLILLVLAGKIFKALGWQLSWPWMLFGLMFTMKVVWLIVAVHGRRAEKMPHAAA